MKQKIIRISTPLHNEYKKLVSQFPTLTLSSATEILIGYALKRGEIEESKETAYKAVKELDQTFRKWMRQQEKTHLSKISEELLALAHELRDTTTKEDLKSQSERIAKAFEDSYTRITEVLVGDYSKTKKELEEVNVRIEKMTKVIEEKLSKKIF